MESSSFVDLRPQAEANSQAIEVVRMGDFSVTTKFTILL